jgi:hypothetical protein
MNDYADAKDEIIARILDVRPHRQR